MIDIDTIYNTEFPATVKISANNRVVASAFLMDNFSYSMSSNFNASNNLVNKAVEGLGSILTSGTGMIGKALQVGKAGFQQLGRHTGQSIWQTVKTWTSSDVGNINIRIIVIEKRSTENKVRDTIKALASLSLASILTDVRGLGESQVFGSMVGIMKAPNDYGFTFNREMLNKNTTDLFNAQGTVDLIIGTGYGKVHMKNMVVTSLEFEESIAMNPNGNPIYVAVRIGLTHWRTTLYEDFTSWLRE